jgi:hypothetical protein
MSNVLNCTEKSRLITSILLEIFVPQASKVGFNRIKGESTARGKNWEVICVRAAV